MKKIDPKELTPNAIKLIDEGWMLVTAGKKGDFNTMTASWGGIGELWLKPVAFVFIRPQRYTYQFTERNEMLTLSFLGEEHRPALRLCGSKSGRDTDKIAETGLTPYSTKAGNIAFREADITLECRILYKDDLRGEAFVDRDIIAKTYPTGDFHRMYVVEIVNAWVREG